MASDLTPEELAAFRSLSRRGLVTMVGYTVGRLLDMAERCADYDRRLSEVMPKDFKDWWQNSRQCWPEMAAWSITNLRQREDWAHEQMARALAERDCLNEQCDYYKADLDAIRAMVPNVEGVATQDLVRQHLAKLCKCSLRTKLVGDGCDICNPEANA